MKELLRNDLKRFFLNKLTVILVIVAFAFPLFSCLIMRLPSMLSGTDFNNDSILNFDNTFNNVFSFTDGFGIILPIFGCVLLDADRKSGMQRNKLICGKTRTQVYLSQLISCMLYFLAGILIYVASNFLFGFALLGGFSSRTETVDVILFILVGLIKFASFASFITFIGLRSQKSPIGLAIAYMFGVELLISILNIVVNTDRNDDLFDVLARMLIGGVGLTTPQIILDIFIYGGVIAATILGGLSSYQKKDIK